MLTNVSDGMISSWIFVTLAKVNNHDNNRKITELKFAVGIILQTKMCSLLIGTQQQYFIRTWNNLNSSQTHLGNSD